MGAVSRASAVVDLGAVERNCARLAGELSGGVELCAVVKANGYGHGAIECARSGPRRWREPARRRDGARGGRDRAPRSLTPGCSCSER